jgi:hypothetical protein
VPHAVTAAQALNAARLAGDGTSPCKPRNKRPQRHHRQTVHSTDFLSRNRAGAGHQPPTARPSRPTTLRRDSRSGAAGGQPLQQSPQPWRPSRCPQRVKPNPPTHRANSKTRPPNPATPVNQVRPVSPAGRVNLVRPVSPAGRVNLVRPVSPAGRVNPVRPVGRVNPVNPAAAEELEGPGVRAARGATDPDHGAAGSPTPLSGGPRSR